VLIFSFRGWCSTLSNGIANCIDRAEMGRSVLRPYKGNINGSVKGESQKNRNRATCCATTKDCILPPHRRARHAVSLQANSKTNADKK
jgi:hypothetical protein